MYGAVGISAGGLNKSWVSLVSGIYGDQIGAGYSLQNCSI